MGAYIKDVHPPPGGKRGLPKVYQKCIRIMGGFRIMDVHFFEDASASDFSFVRIKVLSVIKCILFK